MYSEDSFFSLTYGGRIGLAVLSSVLMLFMIALSASLARRRRLMLRVCVAVALFWAFVWLSPQIYYTYYMFLFNDLPVQSVIKSPPGPERIAKLLTFTERQTLAAHTAGVMGWAMILVVMVARRRP